MISRYLLTYYDSNSEYAYKLFRHGCELSFKSRRQSDNDFDAKIARYRYISREIFAHIKHTHTHTIPETVETYTHDRYLASFTHAINSYTYFVCDSYCSHWWLAIMIYKVLVRSFIVEIRNKVYLHAHLPVLSRSYFSPRPDGFTLSQY